MDRSRGFASAAGYIDRYKINEPPALSSRELRGGDLAGISFFALGLVCLGLAVLWYFVWPRDRISEPLKKLPGYKPRSAWAQTTLRWFHALAWALLAVTCWLLEAGQEQLATVSALIAGIMYVTFVAAIVKDGQRRKTLEHESLYPPADRQSGG